MTSRAMKTVYDGGCSGCGVCSMAALWCNPWSGPMGEEETVPQNCQKIKCRNNLLMGSLHIFENKSVTLYNKVHTIWLTTVLGTPQELMGS